MITIDYETAAIGDRPEDYPPKPVGIGIKINDEVGRYYGFGHPSENNCTEAEAKEALENALGCYQKVICQNGKFDHDVAEAHWGVKFPKWEDAEDTQFLLYLYDPHSRSLKLKESAERILDWPPEEQDRLKAWIMANVREAKLSDWGAYIGKSPGGLCGEYCIGDIDRTYALFQHLYPYICNEGMDAPYQREKELMPVMLKMEREGIRVNREALKADIALITPAFEETDERLSTMLGMNASEMGSRQKLAHAILSRGYADTLPRTDKGNYKTDAATLLEYVTHPQLLPLLAYRGAIKTCLGTFMSPWEIQSRADSRLHGTWHQTRGEEAKGGTRTGRPSCAHPNLMNIPKPFDRELPEGMPPIPLMREYLLPERGHVWLKRDYSAQEVRVLAHFEDGVLMHQFIDDPAFDPHQYAADQILALTGHVMSRDDVKRIVFSVLYGSGVTALSVSLGVDYNNGKMFKELYMAAMPGVSELTNNIKSKGKAGLGVRTVGGRVIFAENHGGRDWSYKLLNHLIQGSAADVTKQGMINYDKVKHPEARILAAVYDENNVSVPEGAWEEESLVLNKAMCDVTLDVPLTTDYYIGRNWHDADNHKEGTL